MLPGHQLIVPLEGLLLQFLNLSLALLPDFTCNLLFLGQPESVQFKKNFLNAGLVEGVIFLLNLKQSFVAAGWGPDHPLVDFDLLAFAGDSPLGGDAEVPIFDLLGDILQEKYLFVVLGVVIKLPILLCVP